jgi:hypothetical protein
MLVPAPEPMSKVYDSYSTCQPKYWISSSDTNNYVSVTSASTGVSKTCCVSKNASALEQQNTLQRCCSTYFSSETSLSATNTCYNPNPTTAK